MRLKHEEAGEAAHPVDVGEALHDFLGKRKILLEKSD